MNVYFDLSSPLSCPTVVALGCFDGVHLGHAAVLRKAKEVALTLGHELAAFTFTEPPKNFFSPGSVSLLTDTEEKAERMRELGVDRLFTLPFDRTLCAMTAETFFDTVLLQALKATHLVCGFNYSFGAGGRGNAALLHTLCEESGIGLTVLPPISVDGAEVSSSAIRRAIMEGRPAEASAMLGRPYALHTAVVDGQKLARNLGFPTLNQIIPEGMTVPRHGVYVSRICVKETHAPYYGISNVGLRPTVGGTLLCAETHIFSFEGDLYGKTVRVELLEFLRDEVKFDSLEALTVQVQADILRSKEIVANNYTNC